MRHFYIYNGNCYTGRKHLYIETPLVASFTKEVNWRLDKRPLKTNGHLANRQLTSLVK